ncbi:MAG TPA: uroporphyrinogen decarboxylase family protein [Clostridia bacterium]|nr:uroporphyrinogen decarboxylase family protein [Clostridia bacterium]
MSYELGMQAINLEMPDIVPRTEYAYQLAYGLQKAVTGIDVNQDSDGETKFKAVTSFEKIWDISLFWATKIGSGIFGDKRTKMGHAGFEEGYKDFIDNKHQAFTDLDDIYNMDFDKTYGSINIDETADMFYNDLLERSRRHPTGVNTTGIYVTCISGMLEILGWDMLLLAAGEDAKRFGEFTIRYSKWISQYFKALAKSKVPVCMIHDDMVWSSGPFIAPSWYDKYVFPYVKKNISYLKEAGKKVLFTCDGGYDQFIDRFADMGIDAFIFEPLTDLEYICEKYGKTHAIIGNADTRIIMRGTKEDIENEVRRCMDAGKKCPGYMFALGNQISPGTKIENLLYYNEMYEKMKKR